MSTLTPFMFHIKKTIFFSFVLGIFIVNCSIFETTPTIVGIFEIPVRYDSSSVSLPLRCYSTLRPNYDVGHVVDTIRNNTIIHHYGNYGGYSEGEYNLEIMVWDKEKKLLDTSISFLTSSATPVGDSLFFYYLDTILIE